MKKYFVFMIMMMLCHSTFVKAEIITGEAKELFQASQKSVYQIRTIDLETGKKASIGSGFQFTEAGHIATNYHVISQMTEFPKRYKIEGVSFDGEVHNLSIVTFDMIHDVAIVRLEEETEFFLQLGDSQLAKGARVFSLGNPHDLGMTIVEGLFNGHMQHSLYRKILVSESLNPGMSGGPAIDEEGKVIGINVSTAGNQISFLVPVDYLNKLRQRPMDLTAMGVFDGPKNEIDRFKHDQLIKNQKEIFERVLSLSWETTELGDARVVGKMGDMFKCWGKTEGNEEKLYQYSFFTCSTEDQIFVSDSLYTGQIIYRYNLLSSDHLNTFQFYSLYQNSFLNIYNYGNADKEDVTKFQCDTYFIDLSGKNAKVSYCARQYKKFKNIYDTHMTLATVDDWDNGLLVEMIVLGVTKEKMTEFLDSFLKGITWKK